MPWTARPKTELNQSGGGFPSHRSREDRRRIEGAARRSLAALRARLSSRSRQSTASRCGEASSAACRASRPHARLVRADSERPRDSGREPHDAAEPRRTCPCARCSRRRRGGARSPTSAWTGSRSFPPWAADRTRSEGQWRHADSRRSTQLQRQSAPRRRAAGARPPRDGVPCLRRITGAGFPLRSARRRHAPARLRA